MNVKAFVLLFHLAMLLLFEKQSIPDRISFFLHIARPGWTFGSGHHCPGDRPVLLSCEQAIKCFKLQPFTFGKENVDDRHPSGLA